MNIFGALLGPRLGPSGGVLFVLKAYLPAHTVPFVPQFAGCVVPAGTAGLTFIPTTPYAVPQPEFGGNSST